MHPQGTSDDRFAEAATIVAMPLFLLGAGFNADAKAAAGPILGNSRNMGRYEISCTYPLVGDTLALCFQGRSLSEGNSIESLFAEALERRDFVPLRILSEELCRADYYLARKLCADATQNAYRTFFERFRDCDFLTFNYDSLPETILFHLGAWNPEDGYGMPVQAPRAWHAEDYAVEPSKARVLHLHGSLCVKTSEFEFKQPERGRMALLVPRERPLFTFDPGTISHNFPRYAREPGTIDVEDRVIAPIPNKAEGLNAAFVQETYRQARSLVRHADILVAVGYRFGPHDHTSFDPVLETLSNGESRSLVIVSPDARTITERIQAAFPMLVVRPIPTTFTQWVDSGCAGL